MEIDGLSDILTRGSEILGLTLSPDTLITFRKYYDFLDNKSQDFNLTAISGIVDVARLHFLDSIALLKTYPFDGAHVIDIGSGAGFPGVPIKIVEPSINLTLLDATVKRIEFLSELCAILGVSSTFICDRAEEASRKLSIREKYDIAVSRAVARLNVLCELCLPFVRVGGIFIAMKAEKAEIEISESESAIIALGGQLQKCIDYTIPDTDIIRRAVIISKTDATPVEFPRRFAKIQKQPL